MAGLSAIGRADRTLRLGTLALVLVLALAAFAVAGLREAVLVATPPLLAVAGVARLLLGERAWRAKEAVAVPSLAEGLGLGGLAWLTFTRHLESPLLLVVVGLLLVATFLRRRLAERQDATDDGADAGDGAAGDSSPDGTGGGN